MFNCKLEPGIGKVRAEHIRRIFGEPKYLQQNPQLEDSALVRYNVCKTGMRVGKLVERPKCEDVLL